jgi:hypothetical protein
MASTQASAHDNEPQCCRVVRPKRDKQRTQAESTGSVVVGGHLRGHDGRVFQLQLASIADQGMHRDNDGIKRPQQSPETDPQPHAGETPKPELGSRGTAGANALKSCAASRKNTLALRAGFSPRSAEQALSAGKPPFAEKPSYRRSRTPVKSGAALRTLAGECADVSPLRRLTACLKRGHQQNSDVVSR